VRFLPPRRRRTDCVERPDARGFVNNHPDALGQNAPPPQSPPCRMGAGMLGNVYEVIHTPTCMTLALKCIHLPDAGSLKLEREMWLHESCDHPCVVPFYGAFVAGGFLCMAMELAEGTLGEALPHVMGETDEYKVRRVLFPIIAALTYLHSRGILHRDIKAGNVLTGPGTLLLTDFGFAIATGSGYDDSDTILPLLRPSQPHRERAMTMLGTMGSLAPELILARQGPKDGPLRHTVPVEMRDEYGFGVDVWALGVLAWKLFTGVGELPLSPTSLRCS